MPLASGRKKTGSAATPKAATKSALKKAAGPKRASRTATSPTSGATTGRTAKRVTKASAAKPARVKAAGPKPARKTSAPEQTQTEKSARLAAKYALEKKGEQVRLFDLRQVTSMTDFFVIVSADSDKQVKAIAENVIAEMRDTEATPPWHSEGWDTLRWVIIDFVDFVVHVFQKEARLFYNLERLWADAPVFEIEDVPEKPGKRRVTLEPTPDEEAPTPLVRIIHE